jgi:SNF family Na+-dependent transporter
MNQREHWGTRIGLILAMAGNAIGLGNFLRFPVEAAKHGGGVFMIPYIVSLFLIGIPLMWLEWTIGRYAGIRGHGSPPAFLSLAWKHPIAKYLGVIGLFTPTVIAIYYVYIESWTLAYGFFSLTNSLPAIDHKEVQDINAYLTPFHTFHKNFLGDANGALMYPDRYAYIAFIITLFLNMFILSRGIVKGIERVAKIAMPVLFLFAIVLVIRVFTLKNPANPDVNIITGLKYIWEPDFSKISDPSIWLAAAGQIFFTLSLGTGAIQVYASYLREKDDLALSGFATATSNELAEVILGGSIAIPAAIIFFGVANAQEIAQSGAFRLGFITLPAVFQNLPFGNIFGALWFFLLFFAGITSSLALCQPAISFLEDELKLSRKESSLLLGIIIFFSSHLVIFFKGAIEEMDFWAGTFGLVLFATIETLVFMWIFGGEKVWEELHKGADIKVPRVFFYILKYISPLLLLTILVTWFWKYFSRIGETASWNIFLTRGFLIYLFVFMCAIVGIVWKRREE